jgi:short-subunit dehydrogenase
MENRVVIVTGASSGIGRAAAFFLMKKGFHVYGTSRKAAGISDSLNHETDKESGGFINMIPMDVNSDDSVKEAISSVFAREGRIDILVSNAGNGIAGSIEDVTMDEAKMQFETNFFGSLRVIKEVLPIMRAQKSGKIIVIGSVAGIISIPYQSHYSCSKFALEALVEALRHEVSPFNIKACIVEPGDTKTGFTNNRYISENSLKSPYHERFQRSLSRMQRDEMNGVSPELVAKTIYNTIKKKNPPIRTAVGFQYKTILFLKRIVPARLAEKLVGMLYN